jgi:hypothetical protein
MRKGSIDVGTATYDRETIVIDSELLFRFYKKYWIIPTYKLSTYNRKLIHFSVKLYDDNYVDDIYIGTVDNYPFRKTIIEDILRLPFAVMDMKSEENYGRWMEIIKPSLHFATERRKYYNKRSIVITEAFIDSGVLPEKE